MNVYNRYTPQPDGTYKCKTINSPVNVQSPVCSGAEDTCEAPQRKQDADKCIPPERHRLPEHRRQRHYPRYKQEKSAVSFLRDLLPRDLDTGDLLIVILLLLMSADTSGEEHGNALLTLALYLFM